MGGTLSRHILNMETHELAKILLLCAASNTWKVRLEPLNPEGRVQKYPCIYANTLGVHMQIGVIWKSVTVSVADQFKHS